jgi:hypothetical protein
MTQRLCSIDERKPLFMPWKALHEMFGGELPLKHFKVKFPKDLLAARTSYPEARIEETPQGFRFRRSPTPIPKTQLFEAWS